MTALPLRLAGPQLRRATPEEITLWIATSEPITPDAIRVEVWDPLPVNLPGYVDDPARAGILGVFDPARGASLRLLDGLYVHLLRVTPLARRFPVGRALAYRVAVRGVVWDPPAAPYALPGRPPRVGPPFATAAGTAAPFGWFAVTDRASQWSTIGLHAASLTAITNAETYARRGAEAAIAGTGGGGQQTPGGATGQSSPRAIPQPNPAGRNVAATRVSSVIVFAGDSRSDTLAHAAYAIAPALCGNARDDASQAVALEAAVQLLRCDRALWDHVIALPPYAGTSPTVDQPSLVPDLDALLAASSALAALAAHAPIVSLEDTNVAIGPDRVIARATWYALAAWGTAAGSLAPLQDPRLGQRPSERRVDLVAPRALLIRDAVVATDKPADDAGEPRVVVSATPYLAPDGKPTGPVNRPAEDADATLFLSVAPRQGYLATNGLSWSPATRAADAAAAAQRITDDGTSLGRVVQVALSAPDATNASAPAQPGGGAGNTPSSGSTPALPTGPTVRWSGNAYVEDPSRAGPIQVSPQSFVVLARAGAVATITAFDDSDKGAVYPVPMRPAKRAVAVAGTRAGAVYIGNRFRENPDAQNHERNVDGTRHLGGVVVTAGGQPGNSADTGLVADLLQYVPDGTHTVVCDGPLTWDAPPGPDLRVPAQATRMWRRTTFSVVVEDHAIVEVDGEPVPLGRGIRLLLDPVWMRLVAGWKGSQQGPLTRRSAVGVVVHALGGLRGDDARFWASTWQGPTTEDTAAHYLLARDGTLIKQADELWLVNHAVGRWRNHDVNADFVGIEIARADNDRPFTPAQYKSLIAFLAALMQPRPTTGSRSGGLAIDRRMIVGHDDVRPGDHADPFLTFDWTQLESCDLGMLGAPPPFSGPYPRPPFTVPPARTERWSTPEWTARRTLDIARYETSFGRTATRAQVQQTITTMLGAIGYNLAGFTFSQVYQAFRSHFFSGPRRHFWRAGRTSHREEDASIVDDEWRLTAVWIKDVHDALFPPTTP